MNCPSDGQNGEPLTRARIIPADYCCLEAMPFSTNAAIHWRFTASSTLGPFSVVLMDAGKTSFKLLKIMSTSCSTVKLNHDCPAAR